MIGSIPYVGTTLYVLRLFDGQAAGYIDALWDVTCIVLWDSTTAEQPPYVYASALFHRGYI